MLILDLRGVHAQGELTFRSAARWSAAWIGLGLLFSVVILGLYDPRAQLTYFTGALVMRGALITTGMYLLERYHWVTYVFAALIILAALRMLFGAEQERKVVVAACAVCGTWVARILPITHPSCAAATSGSGRVALSWPLRS
jgi:tellurite resistance protein TerC